MKSRFERLDLLHQPVGELLAVHHRKSGNVVDRLLGIQLGALPPRPVEDIDDLSLQIEKTELENGEQADRTRAENHNICFDSHSGTALGEAAAYRKAGLVRQPEPGKSL